MAQPSPRALPAAARAALLAWYDARGRTIAFRATRDPYAILVSEVMAQQTQISRVEPAWRAFLERFPTVRDLAAAAPADVLRAWQGMGYDRRALNLRRAAEAIVAEHRGEVPSEIAALERLPGIGPYTARAIAAIAFGQPAGAVDTNVRRVLGRALGLDPGAGRDIQAAADGSVRRDRPGDWTHAVMDLGATVCRPRAARCDACPIAGWCRSAGGAGSGPTSRTTPRQTIPFTSTTRWLRGRILDRLRSAEDRSWTAVEGPIGDHGPSAVEAALRALARDGLVEMREDDRGLRARLATA